ncbi:hypothetical protein NSPZN2_40115 [Nitrospira defluvii]|uniref:Transposase n=1 Tax=Nitrospira defluvii TaxID=330214 RepID=A0ABN7LWR5_9BACT|nr:hypothetical protein NSPZN2_40115 [Nitrospira defluvii]
MHGPLPASFALRMCFDWHQLCTGLAGVTGGRRGLPVSGKLSIDRFALSLTIDQRT